MSSPGNWNGIPNARHVAVCAPADRDGDWPKGTLLPYGNGRSYGDVCLSTGATLLHTRWLDHLLAFDPARGTVRVEAGLLLADLLGWLLPRGWCLPVLPGTALATVGGAVANDVHGKNHFSQGSFGHHVLRIELRGSGGERWRCSPNEEPERFRATVGGLGLTGLITWVELRLMRVRDAGLVTRARRFASLDEFWGLAGPGEQSNWPYQVAWFDCLHAQGRGLLFEARHATENDPPTPFWTPRTRRFPLMPPVSLVNGLTLRAMNAVYFQRPISAGERVEHALPYWFPLDGIADWNRVYGPRGFYQYQCLLPPPHEREALRELLRLISRSGEGSFLAVLKRFGPRPATGLLSFPREGTTLALDFPDRGASTLKLFAEFDTVVSEVGGALYPAKDARMSSAMFRASFPQWEHFASFIDPRFQSDFWRRVSDT